MAHFCVIRKSDNVVIHVTPVSNKYTYNSDGKEIEALGVAHLEKVFKEGTPWGPLEDFYFKQTSYNADGTDKKWYNYAGIGHTYDKDNGAYIAPKPEFEPVDDLLAEDPIVISPKSTGASLNIPNLGGEPLPSEPTGEWVLDEKFQWKFIKFESQSLFFAKKGSEQSADDKSIIEKVLNFFSKKEKILSSKIDSHTTMEINKKTGLEKYPYGFWRYIFEDNGRWIWLLSLVLFYIGATVVEWVNATQKDPFGASQVLILLVGFCFYYQWRNWREAQRGETS